MSAHLDGFAQISRLVGTICPGLHSIFSGFTVDLVEDTPNRVGVGFKTTATDPRYMEVAGSGLAGTVASFMRWPPVETPALAELAAHVAPDEFKGSVSLLIGASRGLGAITAKLLAAGGGRVITYARGKADTETLAEEINAARGAGVACILALDAKTNVQAQLAPLTEAISHLYYFATP